MGLTFLIVTVVAGWVSIPIWLLLQDKNKTVAILSISWITLTLAVVPFLLFEIINLIKDVI